MSSHSSPSAGSPAVSVWDGGSSPLGVSYGKLMMWIFLLSDAFTFSGLLITYGMVRSMHPAFDPAVGEFVMSTLYWPIPEMVFDGFPFFHGMHLPLVFVGLMTFILIMSSVTMVLAVEAGHRMDKLAVQKWMLWTILGGLTFLGCQAWEWTHLYHQGAWWGSNPFPNANGSIATSNFANFFFTITGFNGFHVFSGVVINVIILIMTLKGSFDRKGHYLMVEKAGLYWHFVDLVWVFVFLCFYLI